MVTHAHPASPAWPSWTGPVEHLALPAVPEATGTALAWLEALGEQAHWPHRARTSLLLCADEALANIALHARTPTGDPARIELFCGPTEHGIALRIEDDGAAFDPTVQASPALAASLEDADIGGHGLRLMRHFLRQMLYLREGQRNVLLLEVPH